MARPKKSKETLETEINEMKNKMESMEGDELKKVNKSLSRLKNKLKKMESAEPEPELKPQEPELKQPEPELKPQEPELKQPEPELKQPEPEPNPVNEIKEEPEPELKQPEPEPKPVNEIKEEPEPEPKYIRLFDELITRYPNKTEKDKVLRAIIDKTGEIVRNKTDPIFQKQAKKYDNLIEVLNHSRDEKMKKLASIVFLVTSYNDGKRDKSAENKYMELI